MDPTPGVVGFGDLLTPAGQVVAIGATMSLVEVVKKGLPLVDARISGATMALILSALLYGAAGASIPAVTPDTWLNVVLSWIVVAAGAMGVKAGAAHVQAVRGGYAGVGDPKRLVAEIPVGATVPVEDVPPV